jgi:hypothetical protein
MIQHISQIHVSQQTSKGKNGFTVISLLFFATSEFPVYSKATTS